jgi:eukaryotic-like serine/threonine-protein kinase
MSGDLRVERLIEEILDSDCTPEEACGDCPELLPRVKARLGQIRAVDAQFDALFPTTGSCPTPPVPAEAGPPLFPGFEVRELLGRGGMGVVYRAWDRRLNRDVAIKMLIAGAFARPEELERFLRGAEAEAGLRHPNVVQVYDVGDLDGRPYFTMEFVEGGSLAQRLAAAPMPPAEAAVLVATLADAVQAAHDGGVVHRDLKPANVLLTADGTPKVTDFGLARRLDDGAGLTQTGAALGTPSYMAPEQAQGKSDTVGPAADVYALGAILYESLTGRPPFRSGTAAETIRQVIDDEPVPPSRLNARVARDLETICLKCLSKEPGLRYLSAAALAEDLRRFGRGEAITARPTGPLERSARWLRRRRVQVGVFFLGSLLGPGLFVCGVWLWSQHEAGIRRDLERARREQSLVVRADAIRLKRSTLAEGRFNPSAERRFSNARADRDYEAAFRDAGLGSIGDNLEAVAARVAASAARRPLVAALDDWAVCAADGRRQAWILGVARRADPDAWRDRVRDSAAWDDCTALAGLARTASVAGQPAPLLTALGERLRDLAGDGTAFLARVHREHPDDFWAALTLARALQESADPEAAVNPYRRALELRGDSAAIYSNLGLIPHARRDWREAYDRYEKALAIDGDFAPAHNNLGLALKGEGKWDEAIHHFREAVRLDPELAPAHYNLAEIRAYQAGLDEALIHYGQALRIDPAFALAEYMLGVALAGEGRLDEALDRNRRAVQIDPADAKAHDKIFGHAAKEGLIHYHQTLELDPQLSLCRNNLGLSPRDADRLNQAIGHYEKALRLDPGLFRAHASLGQALLALGRFRDALAATRRCLDRMPRDHELHANVIAQLGRSKRLIDLQDRLPAVLRGKDRPTDVAETLEFAELCGIRGQLVAAARLYAEALATSPQSAQDIRTEHRYRAACAAALVGCGRGGAGVDLSREERARWRGRAREWLRAEVTLWTKTLDGGPQADQLLVRNRLTHLWADPDLAGLFERDALDKLPAAERQECRTLWGEVDSLIGRAQDLKVDQE